MNFPGLQSFKLKKKQPEIDNAGSILTFLSEFCLQPGTATRLVRREQKQLLFKCDRPEGSVGSTTLFSRHPFFFFVERIKRNSKSQWLLCYFQVKRVMNSS